jgi:hypothetical protein
VTELDHVGALELWRRGEDGRRAVFHQGTPVS